MAILISTNIMQRFTSPSELTESYKSGSNSLMRLCSVEISFLEQNPENEILLLNGISGDISFDNHFSASVSSRHWSGMCCRGGVAFRFWLSQYLSKTIEV